MSISDKIQKSDNLFLGYGMNPKIRRFEIQKSKKPRISKIQTSRNIDGPSQNGGLLFKHLFGELSNLT